MASLKPEYQPLTTETIAYIRDLALEQVRLMDELEAALVADDTQRVLEIARKMVGVEKQVRGDA